MFPVSVENPDILLMTNGPKQARREVKQRRDAGVGLIVVVAECTFIVALQPCNSAIRQKRPVVAERLIHFEFDSLIDPGGVNAGTAGIGVANLPKLLDEFVARLISRQTEKCLTLILGDYVCDIAIESFTIMLFQFSVFLRPNRCETAKEWEKHQHETRDGYPAH